MTKIKALVLGFTVGIAVLFVGTSLLAREPEVCHKTVEQIVGPVTDARDNGIPTEVIFQQLQMVGMSQEAAYNFVHMIYVVLVEKNKEEVIEDYLQWCLGESA